MSRLSTERRLRFSVEQDLQLLREVIRQNPFENVDRWKEVHENFVNKCNIPFSLRTCKDHCNHLLNLYLKESLKIRPRESRTEFAKKKKYLQEILELRKIFNADNVASKSAKLSNSWEEKDDSLNALLKQDPDTLHSRLEDNDDDDDDFYWKEDNEKEDTDPSDIEEKLRKQELALQERKLALKEQQNQLEQEMLAFDKMEQGKRMEIESAAGRKMSGGKMWRKPRERLRYTNEHSLMLLKEVLDRNPFEDPYRWSTVHENFVRMTGRPHTLRSVREHVDYLLKLYVKGDLENKARYKGSDEEHQEKLQMLQEVLVLKEKYFDVIQEKKPKDIRIKRPRSDNSSNEDVEESTDMFLDDDLNDDNLLLQNNSSVSSTYDGGALTNAVTLQFLKEKHATEVELKKKELELKDRKISLAEKEYKLAREKFDFERQERTRRLQMETQERTTHLRILEQQQKVLLMFFEQNKN
ncbi:hypothetical protein GWI33_022176 [Rhynchophorus ferrugineus]|uniref:Uncharacterized protein n=1 Tax=Rhynchophorus ferrugineus TaxID=354439 RepID=A0A834IQJ9_RHYFE|nr:hypothetical protein GWI33_022176 [Rhynchophorus ferrugineus]